MSGNKKPTGKRGIYWKSNTLYARMVVPKDRREHFDKGERWKSLQTRDLKTAEYRASQLFHQWRAEFDKLRGSTSALEEALRWKRSLEEEKRRDADLMAAFKRENPYSELTSAVVDDLGLGSERLGFEQYIEKIERTKGREEAEAIANVVLGGMLPTLSYLDEWKGTLEGRLIPRTIKQHDTRIKRLADKFPALPIKKTEVARWIIDLESQDMAEATIKGLIGGCRVYYNYLLRMGYLDPDGANPFEHQTFTKKKKASKKDKRKAWEPEDVIKLVDAAREKKGDANLHDLILLGAYTGARIEELARLRTEDVKRKNGVLYLSIEEAKSEAGLRDIPVHKDLLPVVENLVEHSPDGYLLPYEPVTENGERSSALGKRFGTLKRKLGYDKRYVFHSLRKTLSTLLERQGYHHNQAAQILGHEKVGMSFGTYSEGLTIPGQAELLNKISYEGLKVQLKEGKRRP